MKLDLGHGTRVSRRKPINYPAVYNIYDLYATPDFLLLATIFSTALNSPCDLESKMEWNESGFRPPLCTYRLNWARRTSWGWWDDWDDTVLQTQDSKFEFWRSEAELATSRTRRLPTILTFTRGWGRNIFCFFQTAETGNRAPDSGVKGSGANHYPRAPVLIWKASRTSEASEHETLTQCWINLGPTSQTAGKH